jgi:class 3 adenylate cyclase
LGVVVASRVQALAADGEIWVSLTIPGLVVGSALEFADRGTYELKGVPGEWALSAVV